jgi:two-component system nitrate/nitrite response regulator NarL
LRIGGISAVPDAVLSIVLADEQSLFLDAVQTRLQSERDMRVVACVETGLDAVVAAADPSVDVLVLSDGLSNCRSIEAVRLIRDVSSPPRMLWLAARQDPSTLMSALAGGVTGYLDKACSFDELVDSIRCVSQGETCIPPKMVGPLVSRLLQSREEAFAQRRVLEQLSRRERAVLALLARGNNNESIARSLVISPQTVKTHVQNIMQKLGVHSRIAAASFAMQDGVLYELLGERPPGRSGTEPQPARSEG